MASFTTAACFTKEDNDLIEALFNLLPSSAKKKTGWDTIAETGSGGYRAKNRLMYALLWQLGFRLASKDGKNYYITNLKEDKLQLLFDPKKIAAEQILPLTGIQTTYATRSLFTFGLGRIFRLAGAQWDATCKELFGYDPKTFVFNQPVKYKTDFIYPEIFMAVRLSQEFLLNTSFFCEKNAAGPVITGINGKFEFVITYTDSSHIEYMTNVTFLDWRKLEPNEADHIRLVLVVRFPGSEVIVDQFESIGNFYTTPSSSGVTNVDRLTELRQRELPRQRIPEEIPDNWKTVWFEEGVEYEESCRKQEYWITEGKIREIWRDGVEANKTIYEHLFERGDDEIRELGIWPGMGKLTEGWDIGRSGNNADLQARMAKFREGMSSVKKETVPVVAVNTNVEVPSNPIIQTGSDVLNQILRTNLNDLPADEKGDDELNFPTPSKEKLSDINSRLYLQTIDKDAKANADGQYIWKLSAKKRARVQKQSFKMIYAYLEPWLCIMATSDESVDTVNLTSEKQKEVADFISHLRNEDEWKIDEATAGPGGAIPREVYERLSKISRPSTFTEFMELAIYYHRIYRPKTFVTPKDETVVKRVKVVHVYKCAKDGVEFTIGKCKNARHSEVFDFEEEVVKLPLPTRGEKHGDVNNTEKLSDGFKVSDKMVCIFVFAPLTRIPWFNHETLSNTDSFFLLKPPSIIDKKSVEPSDSNVSGEGIINVNVRNKNENEDDDKMSMNE